MKATFYLLVTIIILLILVSILDLRPLINTLAILATFLSIGEVIALNNEVDKKISKNKFKRVDYKRYSVNYVNFDSNLKYKYEL